MNLDGTVIGAILGFLGLCVSSVSGIYLATRTNKAEKETAAMAALTAKEQKLEQKAEEIAADRLRLKDEEIAQLKARLAEKEV